MTEREALVDLLEAVDAAISSGDWKVDGACEPDVAIQRARQALAQPEQEPVVWMYQDKSTHKVWIQKHMRDFVDHGQTYETPLYTSPPQRTWVELTDDEISSCSKGNMTRSGFARTIEAKLKEKNVVC